MAPLVAEYVHHAHDALYVTGSGIPVDGGYLSMTPEEFGGNLELNTNYCFVHNNVIVALDN